MSRQYRPRRARSSPLWQCLHASLASFAAEYYPDRFKYLGPLDTSRETALHHSLRCGDLANGFLRVQCPDCQHHYLLPFTCKRRGCCPSCHQRRAIDTATFIRDNVCLPVPHRHWVFTLPRILRNAFRKDPHRLTELCHLVAQTLRYYGLYSNKFRGMRKKSPKDSNFKLHPSPFKLHRPRRHWRQRILGALNNCVFF